HAARAIALAPNDPDALELRATLYYFRWLHNLAPDPGAAPRLFASAEADFRAAVEANPMQASALNTLSHLLLAKSQTSEAKNIAQRAYNADPYLVDADRTVWRLFTASLDLGNRVEADRWCTIGAQRFPENFRSTECRLWTYSLKGQVPPADSIWAAHDRFVAESPAQLLEFNRRKAGMIAALGLVRAQLP